MNCLPSDPCACIGKCTVTPSTPAPCDFGNCMKLCDIIVLGKDGVGPCGQAGTIDISDTDLYNHDLTVCGETTITWSFVKKSGPIVSATITKAGVLTWITAGAETAGQYGTVVAQACCGDFSSYMTITIGVKQLCGCPDCEQCETCNPCTGLCEDPEVPMSIETVTNNANISIQ